MDEFGVEAAGRETPGGHLCFEIARFSGTFVSRRRNLAGGFGSLGVLVLTTVRLAWWAKLSPNFNVSVPHVHVVKIKEVVLESGPSMLVVCSKQSGSYRLGFGFASEQERVAVQQEVWAVFFFFFFFFFSNFTVTKHLPA